MDRGLKLWQIRNFLCEFEELAVFYVREDYLIYTRKKKIGTLLRNSGELLLGSEARAFIRHVRCPNIGDYVRSLSCVYDKRVRQSNSFRLQFNRKMVQQCVYLVLQWCRSACIVCCTEVQKRVYCALYTAVQERVNLYQWCSSAYTLCYCGTATLIHCATYMGRRNACILCYSGAAARVCGAARRACGKLCNSTAATFKCLLIQHSNCRASVVLWLTIGYARRGLSEARLTEARARALVPQWGTNSIDYSTDNLLSKYYIYGSI